MFPFFQCPGTSPDRHEFSSIMECGLAAALANSFGTLGFILSVSMDFWTFRFLSGHNPNLLLQWVGFCSLNPCLERCGKRDLPVETEAKYLDLSLLLVCYYPFPSCVYQRSILSLTSLFFSRNTYRSSSYCSFPCQVQLQPSLGFSNPIPTQPGSIPIAIFL